MYVYAKLLQRKSEDTKVPSILIFPRSGEYNSTLETRVGDAIFFDKEKLTLLTYNLERLKEKGVEVDQEFKKIIRDIIEENSETTSSSNN